MHRHRLERLARLTRGAALVSASALAACRDAPNNMNGPDPTPHINATADPTPSTTASAAVSTNVEPSATAIPSATMTATPPPPRRETLHINAPAHIDPPPAPPK
jgi:hypothetical protein